MLSFFNLILMTSSCKAVILLRCWRPAQMLHQGRTLPHSSCQLLESIQPRIQSTVRELWNNNGIRHFIWQTVKAVQRQLGPAGHVKQMKGLSIDLFTLVVDKLLYSLFYQNQNTSISMMYLRDLVWVVVSYFGFLRRSEAVALNVSDLTFKVDNPAHVGLFLHRSKADPLGRGIQVLLDWRGIPIGSLLSHYVSRLQAYCYPAHLPLFMILGLEYRLDCQNGKRGAQATLSGRLRFYLTGLAQDHPHLQIDLTS